MCNHIDIVLPQEEHPNLTLQERTKNLFSTSSIRRNGKDVFGFFNTVLNRFSRFLSIGQNSQEFRDLINNLLWLWTLDINIDFRIEMLEYFKNEFTHFKSGQLIKSNQCDILLEGWLVEEKNDFLNIIWENSLFLNEWCWFLTCHYLNMILIIQNHLNISVTFVHRFSFLSTIVFFPSVQGLPTISII